MGARSKGLVAGGSLAAVLLAAPAVRAAGYLTCEVGGVVEFRHGSASLSKPAAAAPIAAGMNRYPAAVLVGLQGTASADERGPARLAAARAEAVRRALIEGGNTAADRLVVHTRIVAASAGKPASVLARTLVCDESKLIVPYPHIRGELYFPTGSAKIERWHAAVLDRVALAIKANGRSLPIYVYGDAAGDEPAGTAAARAEAARAYLVGRGLPSERLRPISDPSPALPSGFPRLTCSEGNEGCIAGNRHVQIMMAARAPDDPSWGKAEQ